MDKRVYGRSSTVDTFFTHYFTSLLACIFWFSSRVFAFALVEAAISNLFILFYLFIYFCIFRRSVSLRSEGHHYGILRKVFIYLFISCVGCQCRWKCWVLLGWLWVWYLILFFFLHHSLIFFFCLWEAARELRTEEKTTIEGFSDYSVA